MWRKVASLKPSRLTVTRAKPASLSALRFSCQQHAVGRQCYFQRLAFYGLQAGKFFNELLDAVPEQWLAAGQANLLYTERDEQPCNAFDLFKREQFGARQKDMPVKYFARHAISAAQIAAVSD